MAQAKKMSNKSFRQRTGHTANAYLQDTANYIITFCRNLKLLLVAKATFAVDTWATGHSYRKNLSKQDIFNKPHLLNTITDKALDCKSSD